MIFQEKEFILKDGRTAILKSPEACDAQKMLAFITTACGETDFLARYPEEYERIGIDGRTSLTVDGEKMVFDDPLPTHEAAFRLILALLTDPARNILMDIRELNGVGHRFAHGGWHIGGNTLVNGEIRRYIPGCHDLTPLQSPYAELCIDACTALLGAHVPQALVCDTSFHATMPKRRISHPFPKICGRSTTFAAMAFTAPPINMWRSRLHCS